MGFVMKVLKSILVIFSLILFFAFNSSINGQKKISEQTQECLDCHSDIHPGIVHQWKESLHSQITPAEAMKKDKLHRKVSSLQIPDSLKNKVVGCYECHGLNPKNHKDTFEHNGYMIHVVVSPKDCAVCHKEEAKQYSGNLMAHAYDNLMGNSVYKQLVKTTNGVPQTKNQSLNFKHPTKLTNAESCLYCHGTKVEVKGFETKETDFGEMEFPVLTGWPNQGVGRVNPDGSLGSCTSCHSRHDFSIKMARNPATCSECHKGPDVPAYKVYSVSKHGNIYNNNKSKWNWESVPWTVGKDFTAPTCASCHASLIVDESGNVIAERTHKFNDRLAWRLIGVPYSQAHPKIPEISKIKNKAGLQLVSELNGEPAKNFLITPAEQAKRNKRMKKVCSSCHSSSWVDNHFKRLENTIKETNKLVKAATSLMIKIWNEKLADDSNLFDEAIEREWTSIWLFYTNSTKFTSAMGGGGDYGVFAEGRFQATQTLMKMYDWYKQHSKMKKLSAEKK